MNDKKTVLALSLGHFAVDIFSSAIVPLYPYLVKKLGITLATISFIIALAHLMSSMMQPLFGFLADKTRHRFFMFWGLAISTIFIPLAMTSNSVYLLAIFFIIGVGGNALFHPQVTTLINVFTQNNSNLSKYMGIFLGAGTIGYAIAPMVSSSIVEYLGINWVFLFSFVGLVSIVLLYMTVPKIPTESVTKDKTPFLPIMKKIFSSKKMINLTYISVVKSFVSMSCATYFPFILARHGFSLSQTGLIITLFFANAGVATMLSSKIEKIMGVRNLIKMAFVVILPLTILFLNLLDYSRIFAVILFILMGFFVFLSVSVTVVLAQRFMPEHKGVVSGVTQGFSWGIAAILIAPLGILAQNVSIESALYLTAFISFVTGLFFVSRDLEY